MRRTLAAALVMAFLILCALIVPARVPDSEIEGRDAKSIAVTPVSEHKGRNVALVLEVRPDVQKKLPSGLTILVNGKQAHLYDDGRWPDERAGDGFYAAAGKTQDGKPLKEKSVSPIRMSSASLAPAAPAPSIGCSFKSVECPANCRSILFGSKCVACFVLESCSITLD